MSSRKHSSDDIYRFHDYGIYMPTRTIYIGSESYEDESESGTDGAMVEKTVKNLHVLDHLSEDPINIVMNNLGGDEYSCFAIIDAITKCRSHVSITAIGHAMSAGSLILQAADERIMAPLAVQMIHYGTWHCSDHAKTFQQWAKEGERIDLWMEQYYIDRIRQKKPKFQLKTLRSMLDHDTFLTAAESKELGLCDRILGDA